MYASGEPTFHSVSGLKLNCQMPLNGRGSTGRFPVVVERWPFCFARSNRDRPPSRCREHPTCYRMRPKDWRRYKSSTLREGAKSWAGSRQSAGVP